MHSRISNTSIAAEMKAPLALSKASLCTLVTLFCSTLLDARHRGYVRSRWGLTFTMYIVKDASTDARLKRAPTLLRALRAVLRMYSVCALNVSFLSNITPKHFWVLICLSVMHSKNIVIGHNITSVLGIVILILHLLHQALINPTHVPSLAQPFLWSMVINHMVRSSVKEICFSMLCVILVMKKMKSAGARMLPCGTPSN